MSGMKLLRLELTNFKGWRHAVIEPNGHPFTLYGVTGSGKTTFADGLYWLLFGKNSDNTEKFDIKTIDPVTEKSISGLSHRVDGWFLNLAGVQVKFSKVYEEKHVKTRGQADTKFSGHSIQYLVNDVSTTETEYNKLVASLVGAYGRDKIDPHYFNARRTWEERRKILLEMVGGVTAEEVLASKPELAPLGQLLASRLESPTGTPVEDLKASATASRKATNELLSHLPGRINEVIRTNNSLSSTLVDLSVLETRQAELRTKRSQLLAGSTKSLIKAELQAKFTDAVSSLKYLISQRRDQESQQLDNLRDQLRVVDDQLYRAKAACQDAKLRLDKLHETGKSLRESQASLATESLYLSQLQFDEATAAVATACPTCDRPFEAGELTEKRAKVKAEWNKAKSTRLMELADEKTKLNTQVAETQTSCNSVMLELQGHESKCRELTDSWTSLNTSCRGLEDNLRLLKEDLAVFETQPFDYNRLSRWMFDPQASKLLEELKQIDTEYALHQTSTGVDTTSLDDELSSVEALLKQGQETNAEVKLYHQNLLRLKELEAEETVLHQTIEELDRQIWLAEEFIRARSSFLEAKVNSLFTVVNFKLFGQQVNGGVFETCEVMINGVPYKSLSTGNKINAGLDVINALARHTNHPCVVVVDEAQSVTELLPTYGQQLRLVVPAVTRTLQGEVTMSLSEPLRPTTITV